MSDRETNEMVSRNILSNFDACCDVDLTLADRQWLKRNILEALNRNSDVYSKLKDDIFISHIQSHLPEGQVVVCKICGLSAKEIYDQVI